MPWVRRSRNETAEVFRKGAVARGIDEGVAMHIFDLMEKFAGYGFNKSHSLHMRSFIPNCLSKAHYPAGLCLRCYHQIWITRMVVGFLKESQAMKLKVVPANINTSYTLFV